MAFLNLFLILYTLSLLTSNSQAMNQAIKNDSCVHTVLSKSAQKFFDDHPNIHRQWLIPTLPQEKDCSLAWTITSLPLFMDQKMFESYFWIYGTVEIREVNIHFLGAIGRKFEEKEKENLIKFLNIAHDPHAHNVLFCFKGSLDYTQEIRKISSSPLDFEIQELPPPKELDWKTIQGLCFWGNGSHEILGIPKEAP